jgi:intron-binding protein aquarius
LKQALNEQGDVDATCETAGYFYRYTLVLTWEEFEERVQQQKELISTSTDENARVDGGNQIEHNQFVAKNFPFRGFFDNSDELFRGEDFDADLEKAQACWEYIQQIFFKLAEFHAFELLRNGRERSDYLLVRKT